MDAFELNKIAGSVLFALLVFFAIRVVSDTIFEPHAPAKPGFEVAVQEEAPAGGEQAAAPAEPLPVLLQKASAEKGASQARKCMACHTFEAGGPNKVGPNLHGIVGRPVASHAGFQYSDAMKNKGGDWTYEELFKFIHDPQGYVKGTKMTFAGIKDGGQRADLLLYLKEQSPDAPPLPQPTAEAANQQGGQPAEGQPAQGKPAEGQATQQGAAPAGQAAEQQGKPASGDAAKPATPQQPTGAGPQEQAPAQQPKASEQQPERADQGTQQPKQQ